MLIIIWPLLVAIAGLFIYFAVANEKWQKVGLILFAVGAYWTVYLLTGQDFSIASGHHR